MQAVSHSIDQSNNQSINHSIHSRVLLEKLQTAQLVKKNHAIYGTQTAQPRPEPK
jgi:hypothetical protein